MSTKTSNTDKRYSRRLKAQSPEYGELPDNLTAKQRLSFQLRKIKHSKSIPPPNGDSIPHTQQSNQSIISENVSDGENSDSQEFCNSLTTDSMQINTTNPQDTLQGPRDSVFFFEKNEQPINLIISSEPHLNSTDCSASQKLADSKDRVNLPTQNQKSQLDFQKNHFNFVEKSISQHNQQLDFEVRSVENFSEVTRFNSPTSSAPSNSKTEDKIKAPRYSLETYNNAYFYGLHGEHTTGNFSFNNLNYNLRNSTVVNNSSSNRDDESLSCSSNLTSKNQISPSFDEIVKSSPSKFTKSSVFFSNSSDKIVDDSSADDLLYKSSNAPSSNLTPKNYFSGDEVCNRAPENSKSSCDEEIFLPDFDEIECSKNIPESKSFNSSHQNRNSLNYENKSQDGKFSSFVPFSVWADDFNEDSYIENSSNRDPNFVTVEDNLSSSSEMEDKSSTAMDTDSNLGNLEGRNFNNYAPKGTSSFFSKILNPLSSDLAKSPTDLPKSQTYQAKSSTDLAGSSEADTNLGNSGGHNMDNICVPQGMFNILNHSPELCFNRNTTKTDCTAINNDRLKNKTCTSEPVLDSVSPMDTGSLNDSFESASAPSNKAALDNFSSVSAPSNKDASNLSPVAAPSSKAAHNNFSFVFAPSNKDAVNFPSVPAPSSKDAFFNSVNSAPSNKDASNTFVAFASSNKDALLSSPSASAPSKKDASISHVSTSKATLTPRGVPADTNSFAHSPKTTFSLLPKSFASVTSSSLPKTSASINEDDLKYLIKKTNSFIPAHIRMRSPPKSAFPNSIRVDLRGVPPRIIADNLNELWEVIGVRFKEDEFFTLPRYSTFYIDIAMHSVKEYSNFDCSPLVFLNYSIPLVKTKHNQKDAVSWLRFENLPPNMRPSLVKTLLIQGVSHYGTFLEFSSHNPEYMPERFGVTSASIWFVPNEKYRKDPSSIPRVVALADNEGLVQVNPEFTRPHCMWCNNLGHTSLNCNVKKPLTTSSTNPGNKRTYALRDAVTITPTQWVPENLWNAPLSENKMDESQPLVNSVVTEKVIPLPVGHPTSVIATSLPHKKDSDIATLRTDKSEKSKDGFSKVKNPAKASKTSINTSNTVPVSINNQFETIAMDKLKTFVDPEMDMDISMDSDDDIADISDITSRKTAPVKKRQVRKKVKSSKSMQKAGKSAKSNLLKPLINLTGKTLPLPSQSASKPYLSKPTYANQNITSIASQSKPSISSVNVSSNQMLSVDQHSQVKSSKTKSGPAPKPGRIKLKNTSGKATQSTNTRQEKTSYISPYAQKKKLTKETPLSGGGDK